MEKYWLSMQSTDWYGNHETKTLLVTDDLKEAVASYCYWLGMGRTLVLYEKKDGKDYYEDIVSNFYPLSNCETISLDKNMKFAEFVCQIELIGIKFTKKQMMLLWAQARDISNIKGVENFLKTVKEDYDKKIFYTARNNTELPMTAEWDKLFMSQLALI